MPIVKHKELAKHLRQAAREHLAPVYLICGEAYLCEAAFDRLLNTLLPEARRSFNYEMFDGADDNIGDVLERINTYSLLPGTKVVALRDARLFYSHQDHSRILEKVRGAYKEGQLKKAAKLFAGLLGLLSLTFDDVDPATRAAALKLDARQASDHEWIDAVIAFCREQHLTIPSRQDGPSLLQAALEKGFPPGHHLLLTTEVFDRRRRLYKEIQTKGVVVDCSVPKGSRQADKLAQENVLNETMQAVLKPHGKRIAREAFQLLQEMTGFDLTAFAGNLEKLIDYVGGRQEITVADVETVARRTKTDPVYAFTNALADRSSANALFFLDSLLSDNVHPLQALAAVVNQVRKLLVAKDFQESSYGRDWHAAITYRQFQQRIIPAIQAYDRALQTHLADWERDLQNQARTADSGKKQRVGISSKAAGDLILAKNPKNAYPIFQTLLKAANFSLAELREALNRLNEADLVLKTTGRDARIVLEEAVMNICGLDQR